MYKFDPAGQPVDEIFRTIALSQLDEALADLDRGDGDGRSVVHEARRRCKKLRGLLRLVRPVFPDFATENGAVRDAAAMLSHLRDAEVLHQTVADLAKWRKSEALTRIERTLGKAHDLKQMDKLGEFRQALSQVRERVPHWTLRKSGCAALMPGLRVTYRAARERMRQAKETHHAIDFHEWRKANKYHGFHIDLLKKTAPELLSANLDVVDQLSILLGVHHDLTVLGDTLAQHPERFGDEADRGELREAIAGRTVEIETDAFKLGRQILAEKPSAVRRRFTEYWKSAA
jgi:hypothetical protein